MIPKHDPIPTLLDLIAWWVPGLTESHRVDLSQIPEFIPPPLRKLYEIVGNYPVPFTKQWRRPDWIHGLFGPQDQLLPLDQLQLNGDRFRFIHENQGVWSCETVANVSDPPVYSDSGAYEHNDPEGAMREVCSSLSHFLTTFCLQEIVFGSKHLLCVDSEIKNPASLVSGQITDVWTDGWYVFGQPTHSFYLCCESLFVMDTGDEFWLAFNDERARSLIDSKAKTRILH